MKRSSFAKVCLAMLFCIVQLNVIYANNAGTQAEAPAPEKPTWGVSMQSLKKFDEVQRIMARLQNQPKAKDGAMLTNSTITNLRANNDPIDMAWLEVEFTDGTPNAYLNAHGSKVVIYYGETDAFTLPALNNVRSITLRHFGSYFVGDAFLKDNNTGITYLNSGFHNDKIVWGPGDSITGGVEIKIY
jgi:hypothetical protein